MRTQPAQLSYPESIDVLDMPDELADDDATDVVVSYRGQKIGVKEAIAKMVADDTLEADVANDDDWDLRQVRASFGPSYSDDSLPEYDPFND